jgi:hypothetical protein
MEISTATEATDELASAFARLIPQLSATAVPPDRKALAEIIAAPCNTLLIARHEGRIVGTLTLVVFRIPTAVRAWIEDVVVDSQARGSRRSREAARKLYEKAGFTVRDTTVFRYAVPQKP